VQPLDASSTDKHSAGGSGTESSETSSGKSKGGGKTKSSGKSQSSGKAQKSDKKEQ
jgi:hypothetical protein